MDGRDWLRLFDAVFGTCTDVTPGMVTQVVARISAEADDYEFAHGLEDALNKAVLLAIATGRATARAG